MAISFALLLDHRLQHVSFQLETRQQLQQEICRRTAICHRHQHATEAVAEARHSVKRTLATFRPSLVKWVTSHETFSSKDPRDNPFDNSNKFLSIDKWKDILDGIAESLATFNVTKPETIDRHQKEAELFRDSCGTHFNCPNSNDTRRTCD